MDFKQTRNAFNDLKGQFEQGLISADELEARTNELIMADPKGVQWRIGGRNEKWYRFDAPNWVEDMPAGLSNVSPAVTPPESISRSGKPINNRVVNAPERISRRRAPEHVPKPLKDHPQSPKLQKQSNKIPWILGLSVSACACIALASFILISVFSPRPRVLGQMTVNSAGGTFQDKNISIAISPNPNRSPVTLKITKSATDPFRMEQTSQIEIEGALAEVRGVLMVTLPIPADWLTAEGRLPEGESLVVNLQEDIYAPSAGTLTSVHPIDSKVDFNTHTIGFEIPLGSELTAGSSVPHNAALLPRRSSRATRVTVELRLTRGGTFIRYGCDDPSKDFLIENLYTESPSSPTPPLSDQDCERLVNILHVEKKKLEDLGFDRAFAEHNKPIVVYLSNTMGPYQYGLCGIPVTGGYRSSFIQINAQLINGGAAKASIGHELFHLVQFAYNPMLTPARLPNLSVNLAEGNHLKTIWSEEAMSVWFEPYAEDDPTSIPSVALSNMEFINKPFFAPDNYNAGQEQGYGASFFLRYLTNKYGQGLVKEILENQLQQDINTGMAMIAWSHAVASHGGLIEDDWKDFLETYLINPMALGFKSLHTSTQTRIYELALESGIDTSGSESEGLSYDKWYATFMDINNAAKFMSPAKRGYVTRPNDPAHVQLQVPLKDFSSLPIKLTIKDTGRSFVEVPGKLVIQVSCQDGSQSVQACPEAIGLLVYPYPAGAMEPTIQNALSSASDYIWPGGDNQAALSSTEFTSNKSLVYGALSLIPFNNYAATYNDSTNVMIDLYYYWYFEDYYLQVFGVPYEYYEPGPAIPTDTPVPDSSTFPQSSNEMSPEELCACEAKWMNEIFIYNDEQFWKDEYGSNFISDTLMEYQPYIYDPNTGMCVGDYATELCFINSDGATYCANVWGDLDGNGLMPMSQGLDGVLKHIEDSPGFSCE